MLEFFAEYGLFLAKTVTVLVAALVVIGAALYLLLQIPILLKQKGTYSPTLGLNNAAVREVYLGEEE